MADLPMRWNAATAAGPQWAQTFGIPVDLTGLTWEFVVRTNTVDKSEPPLVRVTETSSAQGQITVDVAASTVQVVLNPAATAPLGKGAWAHALYSNANTAGEICWVAGIFNTSLVAAP